MQNYTHLTERELRLKWIEIIGRPIKVLIKVPKLHWKLALKWSGPIKVSNTK